jgi:hypothetical protein
VTLVFVPVVLSRLATSPQANAHRA